MGKTIQLGESLVPKLTLTTGSDHIGSYTEPDEVVIEVKLYGQELQTFRLTESTVVLDPIVPGVYRAKLIADAIGTAKIVSRATWDSDEYTVVEEYEVEVIDPFRIKIL